MKIYQYLALAALALFGTASVRAQDTSGPFTDLVEIGTDYFSSPWLGEFYLNAENGGWVWHAEHGWLFLADGATNDVVFLYDPVLENWLFTGRDTYPFLYVFGLDVWVYFFEGEIGPGNFTRKFYNFASMANLYLPPQPVPNIAETATAAGSFSSLVAALVAAELAETVATGGPFTVFAPTDEAFAALGEETLAMLLDPANKEMLANILLYHVVAGAVFSPEVAPGEITTLSGDAITISATEAGLFINGDSQIVATDIGASNGVVHVINKVLLPPAGPGLIPEVAEEAGIFSTLLAAVGAADLAATLSGEGPFTVFAPTDEAFAKLGQETIDNLLLPENKATLANILLYHVVPGRVLSTDLEAGTVAAANEALITISFDGQTPVLNGTSRVTTADIEASNGIIHIIDTVILPPE